MASLHNRISQKELKARLYQETEPRTTISFYRYFPIPDPRAFRDELYIQLKELQVFGRIYVAAEGINAQASVPFSRFPALKQYLESIPGMEQLRINVAVEDDGKSFWVLKIKVRPQIVADGIRDPRFSMTRKGKYVNAEEMNRFLSDPDTIVIDMRNHYEYEVGHFERAREIPSDTFREQLPMAIDMLEDHRHRNIIMYCTGGIRCEKASAYLLHNGFQHVYHLEGGVIHYANQVKTLGLPNRFIGKNFVFDERLGERITHHIISYCHQCGEPADTHTNCANEACHLLFIQCEACRQKMKGCCSRECLEFIALPIEEQKERRKGLHKNGNIFNKSRARLRPRINEEMFTRQEDSGMA